MNFQAELSTAAGVTHVFHARTITDVITQTAFACDGYSLKAAHDGDIETYVKWASFAEHLASHATQDYFENRLARTGKGLEDGEVAIAKFADLSFVAE